MKSNQKSSHQKCFFAAQGLCPANRTEPGLQLFCPTLFALFPTLQQKLANAPATQASIVLPAFARSCSADGKKKSIIH
ncbi:hypothetical protein [Mucilaginibacter lappiensis]|uniref:hypothetical protein n=1 Tax=Mucilaginibacter lappiensis TaxID=354630 RepID=UPI001C85AB6C|nr:hypothetical protein [Mucilaginibacter lappiensis]